MNRMLETQAAAASVVARWDHIIRREALAQWRKLRPAVCDAEDVAQEVRLVFLRHAPRLAGSERPVDFITVAARQEAIKAIRRMCREELADGRVHIGDDPAISEMFYSSRSREADGCMG